MISAEKIDGLIPEVLMDSDHFYCVILDVEGCIMKTNRIFDDSIVDPVSFDFKDILNSESKIKFSNALDDLFLSPQLKQHLLLSMKDNKSNLCFEFSVITDSNMDLLGVVGIGFNLNEVDQMISRSSLKGFLEFSSLQLDFDLKVIEVEEDVCKWLGVSPEKIKGRNPFQSLLIPVGNGLEESLKKYGEIHHSHCFLLKTTTDDFEYSGLLSATKNGFQLFLLPKMKKHSSSTIIKPFDENLLRAIPGSIWIVDSEMRVLQQNKSGKMLSKFWKGRSFSEGALFHFDVKNSVFAEFVEKVKSCLDSGQEEEFEFRFKYHPNDYGHWKISIKALDNELGEIIAAFIQVIDISTYGNRLLKVEFENQKLKELALKPSHILRSPLSSMLGLLDLIDPHQLDHENQKYFSYLKPLATELDDVIRSNAKKMSVFD
ncbi:PAS domain-containing protein [Algoriphagus aestuarii]|nr:PAS domain-containing protein [Algoriphagus aestuarii]